MASALGQLVVLDFSRVLAGPLATMVLADLGATVLKVERPDGGDETRSWGPPHDPAGVATYYLSVNRNKRSIALDLKQPADLDIARELAARADVVVENFRPGVMDRLGLGYDGLATDNPGLVYCSITGFGRHAGAELPGYDLLVQAVGGLMSVTGSPDGEPQKVGVALVDVITGLFASTGILAALRHRDATGEGQRVELDLLSSLLAAMVNQSAGYTAGGVVPARMGNAHPSVAPYALFATGEGGLVLAVGNDRQFAALCQVLGRDDLPGDPRFAANGERVANARELRELLERALAGRSASDWSEALIGAGVPAGQVNDIEGAFEFAERLGLSPTGDGEHAPSLVRNPIRLSRTPVAEQSPPPKLGECSPAEALRESRGR